MTPTECPKSPITPGTNSQSGLGDAWKLYVYGTGHFWFLQAIFLNFLLVGLLDGLNVLRSPRRLLLAIAAASAIFLIVRLPDHLDVFSINGAIRLLPFFLPGYGVVRYWQVGGARRWLLALSVLLFAARAGEVFNLYALEGAASSFLSLFLGLAGIASLLMYRRELSWRPLARIGYFSFSIYLLHVFGTAPTRMLLSRVGVDSELIVFSISLVAGLLLPVIFEVTLGRIRWVSWGFLGQKPYRNAVQSGAK